MAGIFNKVQRGHLASLAFKVVEILLAGVVIAGFMNDKVMQITGKILFGLSLVPLFIIIGLVLSSGDDEPP